MHHRIKSCVYNVRYDLHFDLSVRYIIPYFLEKSIQRVVEKFYEIRKTVAGIHITIYESQPHFPLKTNKFTHDFPSKALLYALLHILLMHLKNRIY